MRDPFSWSIPLGRVFGILVRVHILFPLVALGLIMRISFSKPSPPDHTWLDALQLTMLWFFSVFLHELGHCFGARKMNGDATEIMLWPLGGLAQVDIPKNPRAHFITALSGPLVNLVLCFLCALTLAFIGSSFQPPWSPFWPPFRIDAEGTMNLVNWAGFLEETTSWFPIFLSRLFFVNWTLFLLNVLLIGFPLDGGRMLQAFLWPRIGYRQSTILVIFTGFGCMFLVGFFGIIFNEVMVLCLAVYIYVACKNEWQILEMETSDYESGYDFSQGYTSFERDDPEVPEKPKLSWWQRWKKARTLKKIKSIIKQQEEEEIRMDSLLDKLHREGFKSLTEEEHRFMKRFSDRYKNRSQ
jgi:Zn-dependent protease